MRLETEAATRGVLCKKFLEISQKSQENTCARVCILINSQTSYCNFIKKEILAQVLSSGFCEISKNTFLNRTPLVAASVERIVSCRGYPFSIRNLISIDFQKSNNISQINICQIYIGYIVNTFRLTLMLLSRFVRKIPLSKLRSRSSYIGNFR